MGVPSFFRFVREGTPGKNILPAIRTSRNRTFWQTSGVGFRKDPVRNGTRKHEFPSSQVIRARSSGNCGSRPVHRGPDISGLRPAE